MSDQFRQTAFSIDVRVYFEDTDFGGVVYYANYLKFMERARTEFLRSLGFDQSRLFRRDQRMFVVRSAVLDYHAPARFDDLLKISADVTEVRRASVRFVQHCTRENSEGRCDSLVSGDVLIACLHVDTFKPCAIPGNLKTVLNS